MSTPTPPSTSIIHATNQQTLALIKELGDEKLIAIVTSQLQALAVAGEHPAVQQQRLQLVKSMVNAAMVIRNQRTCQQRMTLVAYDAKQVTLESLKSARQDREILEQEQAVHTETIEDSLQSVVKTHEATQGIIQSRIDDEKQRLSKTNEHIAKTEKELREKEQQEQALTAHSRSLAQSLGY